MSDVGADKRSVATDALATLGNILTSADSPARDAIHLAVEPVFAAEDLRPGQDVGILPNGYASTGVHKMLGIVDPFVKGGVRKGERFWLIVYPRQISSLRHVWSHPDFVDEPVATPPTPTPALEIRTREQVHAELMKILTQVVCVQTELSSLTPEQVLEAMEDDGYIRVYGSDAHGALAIPDQAWLLLEELRGRQSSNDPRREGGDGVYFSCSC